MEEGIIIPYQSSELDKKLVIVCQSSSYLVVPERKLGLPQSGKRPTNAAVVHSGTLVLRHLVSLLLRRQILYRRSILRPDHTIRPVWRGA